MEITDKDAEELAAVTRAARKIAETISPDELPTVGQWYKVDATLVPDPHGEFEFDGVRYRQNGPARVRHDP